jgi:hypothetical protein
MPIHDNLCQTAENAANDSDVAIAAAVNNFRKDDDQVMERRAACPSAKMLPAS